MSSLLDLIRIHQPKTYAEVLKFFNLLERRPGELYRELSPVPTLSQQVKVQWHDRMLFDFFDANLIGVDVDCYDEMDDGNVNFGYGIGHLGRGAAGYDGYSTRPEAESAGFMAAALMLERRLNGERGC